MLGVLDADHEETAPQDSTLIISKLACSLVGVSQPIKFMAGSRAAEFYGPNEAIEQFACNYGLDPRFQDTLDWDQLRITGSDARGQARLVELSGHPFFVATLFLPQLSSRPRNPHTLVVAFLKAVVEFSASRKSSENKRGVGH